MNITNVALELQGDATSQPEGAKEGLEPQLVCLLCKVSLVLSRRIHVSSSSEIWTWRSREVRKLPNEW